MGRFLTGFGAAVLVAGVAWFFTGVAVTDAQERGKGGASPRVAWEYKVFQSDTLIPSEADLNKLGSDGWELATSYYQSGGIPISTHVFKRPK